MHAPWELKLEIIGRCVVRRLMNLMKMTGLYVVTICKARYPSYKRAISLEVSNLIQRNFHADRSSKKLSTDITEFSIPAGKAYLSGIIDCYNVAVSACEMRTSLDARITNTTCDLAADNLKLPCRVTLYSACDCQYGWLGWI